jgi:protein phosphatase
MEPVVDGAAGDNVGQRQVDNRSAAGRAALADPPPPPPPAMPSSVSPPPRRRHRLRWALVAVGLVVVLVGAGIGTYAWALQHWFVGVEGTGQDEHVAVFRGLHTSPFGVDLYRVDSGTDLQVSDLTPDYRSRVRDGIEASDADDAARILATLRAHRLPPCRAAAKEDPASSTAAAPSGGLPSGTLPSGAVPTGPTDTGASGFPVPTGGPAVPSSSTASSTTRTSSAEPGVNCREEN